MRDDPHVLDVLKPRWTSASFLLYLGTFVVLAAAVGAYAYLSAQYGDGAFVGWTALMLGALGALAVGLRRGGAWLAAGLFAYLSVVAVGSFVGAVFTWWGWHAAGRTPFGGWHWSSWALAMIVIGTAASLLVVTRFPLLVVPIVVLAWYVVTDFVSGGGSWSAVVTLLIGLVYLGVGLVVNRVHGFWVEAASGALVGGALVYWWHSSTADFALLAASGVVFVWLGVLISRSSWTVLGALGLLAAAVHFAIDWTTGSFSFFTGPTRVWVPIVVAAVLGFLFVALGLLAARRRDELVARPIAE
ncbi:MAG TPA: hypothetical protein VFL60_07405 [Gaiellaceae bacterium]|nr:hypothetical protein [Gaiellaceae bacterium]